MKASIGAVFGIILLFAGVSCNLQTADGTSP